MLAAVLKCSVPVALGCAQARPCSIPAPALASPQPPVQQPSQLELVLVPVGTTRSQDLRQVSLLSKQQTLAQLVNHSTAKHVQHGTRSGPTL